MDFKTAVPFIEHLSDGEWQSLRNVISSCTETRYCMESCHQKCSVATLLQAFQRNEPKENILAHLLAIINDEQDELSSKPLYCLEQGYCALYCISSCQYGKFMRALTHERALEYKAL